MSDESVLLHETRRKLAQTWLAASDASLPRMYGGDAGRLQRLLMGSTIRYEPFDDLDRPFADELAGRALQKLARDDSPAALLGAMLFHRAHQFDLQANLEHLPGYLVKDYLAWQIAPVAFFRQSGEAARYAAHLSGVVERIASAVCDSQVTPLWATAAMLVAQRLDCTPAYASGLNLRDLQFHRGRLLDWVGRSNGARFDHAFAPSPPGRRKRIGFVARHLRPSAETFAMLPLYEHLKDEFDTILYVCEPDNQPLAQYCAGRVTASRLLPPDLGGRHQTLQADDLDVLFYGTNLSASSHDLVLLAEHRLARVQVTGVANVVTTGLKNIDYFLSGTTSDPSADAPAHYTEKLFRMNGCGHCFSYGPTSTGDVAPITRAELGLDERQVVFVSGANLYKITPELLETWARIVSEVANSVLVMFPFGPNWYATYPYEQFTGHVRSILGEKARVLNPQPSPDRPQLRACYRACDVYLDSFPFAGSTSLVEPLEAGLPLVTCDGSMFRSAMGAAMVGDLGLPELIAGDEAGYIRLAVELGTDPARRAECSKRVRERMRAGPSFLDATAYTRRVSGAFKAMLNEKGVAC